MAMDWDDVEGAIRDVVDPLWQASTFFTVDGISLTWENEDVADSGPYVQVDIEGLHVDGSPYGSSGKRLAITYGIVFVHSFFPQGSGKAKGIQACEAVTKMLELTTLSGAIDFEARNPPSPVVGKTERDFLLTQAQPGANFYRSSASVGFLVREGR